MTWSSCGWGVPAGGAVGPSGETGIDIFNENDVPLDPTKPHIIFQPNPGAQ